MLETKTEVKTLSGINPVNHIKIECTNPKNGEI